MQSGKMFLFSVPLYRTQTQYKKLVRLRCLNKNRK